MIEGLLYGKMSKCQGEKDDQCGGITQQIAGPRYKSNIPGLTEE
jgi:hypothetical protein